MVPELVARLIGFGEVVRATVRLDGELGVRKCEVEGRHVGAIRSLEAVLDHEAIEFGMLQCELEQPLEPGTPDGSTAFERIDQRQQDQGTGDARPPESLRCVAKPPRVRPPANGVVEGPLDGLDRRHRAEVGQGSSDTGASNSLHGHEVASREAAGVVLHDPGQPGRSTFGRRLDEVAALESVEAMETAGSAMRRDRAFAGRPGAQLEPRRDSAGRERDQDARPGLVEDVGVDQSADLASVESGGSSLCAGEDVVRRGCEHRDNAQGVVSHGSISNTTPPTPRSSTSAGCSSAETTNFRLGREPAVAQPASEWVTAGSPIHSRRVFLSLVCWMNRSCSGSWSFAVCGAFQ